MAPRPTTAAVQPPPDVPSGADFNDIATNYLRNFALWCRNALQDKLPARQALPFILLQANDAPSGTNPKVFKIEVSTAGAITATVVPLGGGQP